ncbi:CRISPR-associated helicase/endonuclease Cas3 [Deinococcus planocerae]|uniref:CRISPR-associated helicase/endonuclease Cas3 n=1 Tax=Deinococcus planocerae TaxID=1737569 RepID=UPI000C7E9FE3|nr:CRISPR-associated helicase/endonuclease Cas3 [Deinococcus planocerae]
MKADEHDTRGLSRLLWAKSDRGAEKGRWKPVLAHLLDVAACAWRLLDLEPEATLNQYARDFGYAPDKAGRDATQRWVCALIALHDLGKASPAFQQKWVDWPKKAEAATLGLTWGMGSTKPYPPPNDVSHSQVSQRTLREILQDERLGPACGWNFEVADAVADAVGAHHGFRTPEAEIGRIREYDLGTDAWEDARRELFVAVLTALGVGEAPSITEFGGGAYMRLAGLTSFADWVGSSFDLTRFEHDLLDNPRAYFKQHAVPQAREELRDIGWEKREHLVSSVDAFARVFAYLALDGRPFQPRDLQTAVEDIVRSASAPTLLLVEAPMGEGKTEAAWYAHLALQNKLDHRGLYIALPTQATGNAMFTRTAEFLAQMRAGRRAPALDLQLLHGGKDQNRAYRDLQVQPNTEEDQPTAVRARMWFTHRKRGLLSEYGVGTVDQALLGVLPVAHQFIRLWGLGNRTVVLDEVHAYDVYTGSLIENLVRWLHALGSSVVLISATLPQAKREALMRAYGALTIDPAPYPRVTWVQQGETRARARHVPADPSRALTVGLRALNEDTLSLAEQVRELHGQGGVVAVVVNTVQRAQELYREVCRRLPKDEVLLFHARYRSKDRLEREESLLARLGKPGKDVERPKRFVLIATQVAEQSLDFDADVMLTDLAPVDLILQRAGRLHRHRREAEVRGAHREPLLYVAGLAAQHVPDLHGTRWKYVYQPFALLRAWLILRDRTGIHLPGDVDTLVQAAYAERDPPGLPDEVRRELDAARERQHTQSARHENAALHAGIPHPAHFLPKVLAPDWQDDDPRADDDPAPSRTRLGSESVTVIPLFLQDGEYCLDPGGERARISKKDFDADPGKKAEQVRYLHAHALRLGRREVVNGMGAHARAHFPKGLHWKDIAALQDTLPLVLENHGGRWETTVQEVRVEHDADLGIVYNAPREDE